MYFVVNALIWNHFQISVLLYIKFINIFVADYRVTLSTFAINNNYTSYPYLQ